MHDCVLDQIDKKLIEKFEVDPPVDTDSLVQFVGSRSPAAALVAAEGPQRSTP